MTGPAVPPGGEELREAVERWLRDRVQVPEHRSITASYAFLALPAVRDALAAQEKVRRVEAILSDWEAWDAKRFEDGSPPATRAPAVRILRRALAGDS